MKFLIDLLEHECDIIGSEGAYSLEYVVTVRNALTLSQFLGERSRLKPKNARSGESMLSMQLRAFQQEDDAALNEGI